MHVDHIFLKRNINRLVLLSGGDSVRVVTHTPLGGTRSLTVILADISCMGSRLGMY